MLTTNESAENYLETILMLSEKKQFVRSIDIANELSFTKPSVSRAVKLLRENGDILVDTSGYITLTPQGRQKAEAVYEKHKVISTWLTDLGVDRDTAAKDACRIEHVISTESFYALKRHILNSSEHNKSEVSK